MNFIAYTDCANGFRYFTALTNVGVSFDPRLIDRLIDEHKQAAEDMEARRTEAENHPFVKMIGGLTDSDKQHNLKVVADQQMLAKRITTAEAAVDGHLVREVMCFHTWQEAANYTMGADRGENGFHVPQPEKP